MRSRTTIVNITNHVQQVDRQALYQIADSDNKIVRPSSRDDRANDLVHISGLIGLNRRLMQQLLNNVGELAGQCLPHLRPSIFRGDVTANTNQLVQCHLIPILQVTLLPFDQLQLFFRVIDQRAKLLFLGLTHRDTKYLVHLPFYGTRSILQHMPERLILAVQVAQEMFRALGQVQDRLQVDDLRAGIGNRRETPGQQPQISYIRQDGFFLYILCHSSIFFVITKIRQSPQRKAGR